MDRDPPVAGEDSAEVLRDLHRQRTVEAKDMPRLRDLLDRGVRSDPTRGGIARDDPGDHERQGYDAHHDEQPEGYSADDETFHPVGLSSYTKVTFGYAGLST